MKTHTTNYFNTFIEVSEDTRTHQGVEPPAKVPKTVAAMQYEMIAQNPYKFTSDEVLFRVFAQKSALAEDALKEARTAFFSKGQPCLRTSPLGKTYGFGIHSDGDGKVALYGMETEEYKQLQADDRIKKVKAMRAGRKS